MYYNKLRHIYYKVRIYITKLCRGSGQSLSYAQTPASSFIRLSFFPCLYLQHRANYEFLQLSKDTKHVKYDMICNIPKMHCSTSNQIDDKYPIVTICSKTIISKDTIQIISYSCLKLRQTRGLKRKYVPYRTVPTNNFVSKFYIHLPRRGPR